MRTLLDANALLALVLGEPAMEPVQRILREGRAAMPAANIAEVFDIAIRREGIPFARVSEVVDPLFGGPLEPIAIGADLARRAGEIRSKHYHRRNRSLSLADAILLAASQRGDRIASSDPDVLAVAAELGIETIELPHSGR